MLNRQYGTNVIFVLATTRMMQPTDFGYQHIFHGGQISFAPKCEDPSTPSESLLVVIVL